MAHAVKPGWSKPSTILYASEIPANEKPSPSLLRKPSSLAPISSSFTPMTLW